jgi:hypothetical protein
MVADTFFNPGLVYHVLNRGVGRRTLFEKDGDFLAFEKVVAETLRTCRMRITLAKCNKPRIHGWRGYFEKLQIIANTSSYPRNPRYLRSLSSGGYKLTIKARLRSRNYFWTYHCWR